LQKMQNTDRGARTPSLQMPHSITNGRSLMRYHCFAVSEGIHIQNVVAHILAPGRLE